MEKKIALVTGGNGGIGEAVIRELSKTGEWKIIAPVRKYEETKILFAGLVDVEVLQVSDLGDQDVVNAMFRNFRDKNIMFNSIILTAGAFGWDNDKRKGAEMKSAEQVKADLYHANVKTKLTIWKALGEIYGDHLANTMMGVVSSQAAQFKEDDPLRLNLTTGFKEEGYVLSMKEVSDETTSMIESGLYKNIFLYEAPLIDTLMAQREFTLETVGVEIDWNTVMKPKEAGAILLAGTGLI